MAHRFAVLGAAIVLGLTSACSARPADDRPAEAKLGGDLPAEIPLEIKIGVPSGLTTLDPDLTVQEVDVMTLALTAGTLLRSSKAGLQPGIAERCDWSIGTSYKCTLRPDAKFSDGTPITAKDVVASFERALGDKSNANAGLVANVKSVVAGGEATVTFALKHKQASFPLVLTEGPLGIYPAAGLGRSGYFNEIPRSSGPYQMTERTDSAFVLERNKYYPSDLQPVVKTLRFNKSCRPGDTCLASQDRRPGPRVPDSREPGSTDHGSGEALRDFAVRIPLHLHESQVRRAG